MKDVVKLAAELGIPNVNITQVNLSSITAWSQDYYEMFYGDDFKQELKAASDAAKASGVVELSVWDIRTKNEFRKCHLPWNHFYVSWDGFMSPCCAKPFPKELNFGNVFDSSLMSCLNSEGYQAFRAMWYRNETPDFCRKFYGGENTGPKVVPSSNGLTGPAPGGATDGLSWLAGFEHAPRARTLINRKADPGRNMRLARWFMDSGRIKIMR